MDAASGNAAFTIYKAEMPKKNRSKTDLLAYEMALSWQNNYHHRPGAPFYETIVMPLLKILRLLGTAPFYISDEGRAKYRVFSLATLYSIVVYLVVGSSAVFSVYEIINIPKDTFNGLVDKVLVCTLILPQMILPVAAWLELNKFQKYFDKWTRFETMFKDVTGYHFPPGSSDKFIRRYTIILGILFVVLLITMPAYLLDDLRWYHFPGYVFGMTRFAVASAFWYTTAFAISDVCKKYKELFEQEVSKNLGYTNNVEQYRLLWMKISQIIQKSGSACSLSTSIHLLMTIIYLLIASYEMAFDFPYNYQNGNYAKIVSNIVCAIFWLLALFMYCDSGYKMSADCSQGMLQIVLKLKDSPQWCTNDEPRMNIFLFTLSEYKPITTISGYFTVNRTLFGSIITALVTYMIVLIQFDIATPNPEADVVENADSDLYD